MDGSPVDEGVRSLCGLVRNTQAKECVRVRGGPPGVTGRLQLGAESALYFFYTEWTWVRASTVGSIHVVNIRYG